MWVKRTTPFLSTMTAAGHPQLLRGRGDLLDRLLPEELGRVHADDGQPLPRVLAVPVPQLRDHVLAVVSAVGPELHQHHPPAEPGERERLAVDPGPAGDLGRG